jgi:hypothetical protein
MIIFIKVLVIETPLKKSAVRNQWSEPSGQRDKPIKYQSRATERQIKAGC